MSQQVSLNPVGDFLPSGTAGNWLKIIVIIAIVGTVLYFAYKMFNGLGNGINGWLEDLHLKDDPATVAAKASVGNAINTATSGANNAWSPTFHNSAPDGTLLPDSDKVKEICAQIWDSVGAFYDSPEDGLAAIKECENKASISWVVDNFNSLYQKDLLNWLQSKYDTRTQIDALSQIVTYVSNLPNYS